MSIAISGGGGGGTDTGLTLENLQRMVEGVAGENPPEPVFHPNQTSATEGWALAAVESPYYESQAALATAEINTMQWSSNQTSSFTPMPSFDSSGYMRTKMSSIILDGKTVAKIWKEWMRVFKVKGQSLEEKNIQTIKFHLYLTKVIEQVYVSTRVLQEKENLVTMKKSIRDFQKNLVEKEGLVDKLDKQYNKQKEQSKEELMKEGIALYEQIQAMEGIEKVELCDNETHFLLTTKPVFVKKTTWPESRLAGIYQVKFPVFISNSHQIAILNITQRMDDYDHPCITHTAPCLGNIKSDLEKDIEEVNVIELISDILSYLSSPNEEAGYLRHPKAPSRGPKNGWEWFLENAKKMPEGFNFQKYEHQKHATSSTTTSIGFDTSPSVEPLPSESYLSMASMSMSLAPELPLCTVQDEHFRENLRRNVLLCLRFARSEERIMDMMIHVLSRQIIDTHILFLKELSRWANSLQRNKRRRTRSYWSICITRTS